MKQSRKDLNPNFEFPQGCDVIAPLQHRSVKCFKYQHNMEIFAVLPGCPSWQDCLWPRPSPYRWPPGETLGACPQGNGDGTRPKGLGHPAEGQGVNCPPLSPSRLRSSSGVKVWPLPNLIQIFLAPCCLNLDGSPWTNSELLEAVIIAS